MMGVGRERRGEGRLPTYDMSWFNRSHGLKRAFRMEWSRAKGIALQSFAHAVICHAMSHRAWDYELDMWQQSRAVFVFLRAATQGIGVFCLNFGTIDMPTQSRRPGWGLASCMLIEPVIC
jgi:hypothetical protein